MSILPIVIASMTVVIPIYNYAVHIAMLKDQTRMIREPETGIIQAAKPIFYEGTNGKACLLIHGFIGSPTDFGKLPELLRQAGYAVYVPLLPGHGTDPTHLSNVTSEEIIQSVLSQYDELKSKYNKVILIGMSMGGALSLIVADKRPVDELILLAPYLKTKHEWFYGLPPEWYERVLGPVIPYVYRMNCFKQVFNREAVSHIIDYKFVSLKGAKVAMEISKRACRITKVSSPVLIVHSTKDRATDYKASYKLFRDWPNRRIKLITLKRSNHLILWDYESEIVEKEILKFIGCSMAVTKKQAILVNENKLAF